MTLFILVVVRQVYANYNYLSWGGINALIAGKIKEEKIGGIKCRDYFELSSFFPFFEATYEHGTK